MVDIVSNEEEEEGIRGEVEEEEEEVVGDEEVEVEEDVKGMTGLSPRASCVANILEF